MDLQTGIFCLVFAVASSFIIYIILSISSNKEDSFDEAKANRRKMMKQFQDENKASSDKAKDKKTKKASKKGKEKKEPSDNTDNGRERRNITEEHDSEINVEPTHATELMKSTEWHQHKLEDNVKDKKKIPQNIMEPQQIDSTKNGTFIQQKKTTYTTIKAPIEKGSSTVENKKKKKGVEKENDKIIEVVQEPLSVKTDFFNTDASQTVAQTTAQPDTRQPSVVKSSKKKRSELTSLNQLKNEKEAVSINLLVSLIQKAELSRSEIQMLIDALLNKQQDDVSEWLKGRQDPIVKLKKQLSDSEQALCNEKEVNAGLQAKLRELRAELNNDRITTRAVEEQISALQNEIRGLTLKLQTTSEEKHHLALNVQQFQKQLSEEQMIIKLKEDQIIKHHITEEKSHEAVIALQAQVTQLTGKLQENVRVIEEYQKMQGEMTRAFESSKFSVKELQGELNSQERALADAKSEIENLIISNKTLYEQNDHLSKQVNTHCQELNLLREKNDSLVKLSAENWENGFNSTYNNKQGMAELEARLEEKNNQIEQLTKDLEFTRNKNQELNVSLTKNKTDLGKIQNALEKANSEITMLKEKINEASRSSVPDDVIDQLKARLVESNKEVTLLKDEIDECKQKNNDLRNKNWKMMEALTKAENALQNKIRNEQNTNDQNLPVSKEVSNVEVQRVHSIIGRLLKYLYPDIIVDDNKGNIDEWLAILEEKMSRTMNGADKLNVPELQAHNNHLQSLVVHYKGIITDTERMLNQLQKHVEVEEARWKTKITSLEEEVAKLRSNQTSDVFLHL